MIYLVGSVQRAMRWCVDNGYQAVPHEIRFISGLDQSKGVRPRPSDTILNLGDLSETQEIAWRRLKHDRELSRGRRETSMRQAP